MPLRLAREESTREHKGTVNQYNAPALALTQESNNFNVHKSDFTQVHEYADVLIVHLSLYVADIGRLNSNTELQGGQATRPTVTEFRGLISLSMSEAVRYLTPTVQETTCDRPEAVTAGTDLL